MNYSVRFQDPQSRRRLKEWLDAEPAWCGQDDLERVDLVFVDLHRLERDQEALRAWKAQRVSGTRWLLVVAPARAEVEWYDLVDDVVVAPMTRRWLAFRIRRAVQQIQTARALTEALRFERRVAAIVGHDMRSPIGVVAHSARALRADDVSPTARTTILSALGRAGRQMERLSEDLLLLGQLREGTAPTLKLSPVALGTVLEEVAGDLRMPHRLACDGDDHLVADPVRLRQLFTNLLTNAREHGDSTVPVELRVGGTSPQGVEVAIRNRGTLDESPETLFTPFKTSAGGHHAGLGMFTARSISEAHGGTIDIEECDGWVEVRVCLPRETP